MILRASHPESKKTELLAEVLRQMGWVRVRVQGASMLPALRPGDEVVIEERPWNEIQTGQVVAFQREGRLFVHRVINVLEDQLLTRGDAVPQPDAPVNKDELLGLVTQIKRGEAVVDPRDSWLQAAAAQLFRRSRFCAALFLKFASL